MGPMTDDREGEPRLDALRAGQVPRHVAVIMDGNGRWARQRGLPRWRGHRAGMEAVREVVEGAIQAGVDHLTLYAFSQENWSRPPMEVAALMELLQEYVDREKEELVGASVRVVAFGDRDRLSSGARQAIEDLELATREGDRLSLHLAISYGGRAEILRATRRLAEACVRGELPPAEIDEERFSGELQTAGWPDPDLLIRTSGERRVSNFLLWQIAYSEIYVTSVLWPDFQRTDLFDALLDFQRRDRRFGRVRT